jgi:hypothetical protein
LCAVAVAPGTAAPCASTTRPVMLPVVCWAKTLVVMSVRPSRIAAYRILCIDVPPGEKAKQLAVLLTLACIHERERKKPTDFISEGLFVSSFAPRLKLLMVKDLTTKQRSARHSSLLNAGTDGGTKLLERA